MAEISDELREHVTDRARGCCEYCQAQQDIILRLEVDHIIPRSAGGETTPDNLCLACKVCNGHKHKAQTEVDPETGDEVPLYNPRTQQWTNHFAWSENKIEVIGLTPVGRATIARLHMNDEDVVQARRRWVTAGLASAQMAA